MSFTATSHPSRCADERGFSLIELLVVMIMLFVIFLIALPAFVSQRTKAQDVAAQQAISTAVIALHSRYTDEESFDATVAQLVALEPSLKDAPTLAVTGTDDTFTVSGTSASGTKFTLDRDASGQRSTSCSAHGKGLCRASADASGNWW